MDIERMLDNIATKDVLIQIIKDLPDDAMGVLTFVCKPNAEEAALYGEEARMYYYQSYGEVPRNQAAWMLMNHLDYTRGAKHEHI
jgi:hypothetical protein